MFPDQYHDAVAASRAFLSSEVLQRYGIDPERVCASGDSAGGNLAAAVVQEVENPTPPKGVAARVSLRIRSLAGLPSIQTVFQGWASGRGKLKEEFL